MTFHRCLLSLLITALPLAGAGDSYNVPRFVPPYLTEHRSYFRTETVQAGDYPVWLISNAANQMSNAVLVEGEKELVVFDTGSSHRHGAAILAEIRKISDKPISALVYSHHHGDHCTGAAALVDREDAAAGKVKIIARANFMQEYVDEDFMTGPIQTLRSVYQFGSALEQADLDDYVIGVSGGELPSGTGAFIEPNTLINTRRTVTLAGIEFEFIPSGGEAATHMIAWLPEWKIVLSGDEIYPALPNLHALRGTKFRDARNWVNAIDMIRALEPDYLAPSHGPLLGGREKILRILTVYRDALRYQHDQAIRYINKGYTAGEVAERLSELPESLRLVPYTTEMYGKLRHNIPNIFHGYVGWFSGDAVDLAPTPRRELAQKFITLMGGRDRVLAEAEQSFVRGDAQFAAELATLLLRINAADEPVRQLKSAAFRQLGYRQINSIWRSWYLTAALELEGKFDVTANWQDLMSNVRGAGNLAGLPGIKVLELLRYSVAAEQASGSVVTLRWQITDRNETLYTQIRRGIMDVSRQSFNESVDAQLDIQREDLDALVAGSIDINKALSQGIIGVTGSRQKAVEFFSYIESYDYDISISAR